MITLGHLFLQNDGGSEKIKNGQHEQLLRSSPPGLIGNLLTFYRNHVITLLSPALQNSLGISYQCALPPFLALDMFVCLVKMTWCLCVLKNGYDLQRI